MPTIHVPGDGHVTPLPLADGTRWDDYSDLSLKRTLESALFILKHNTRRIMAPLIAERLQLMAEDGRPVTRHDPQ